MREADVAPGLQRHGSRDWVELGQHDARASLDAQLGRRRDQCPSLLRDRTSVRLQPDLVGGNAGNAGDGQRPSATGWASHNISHIRHQKVTAHSQLVVTAPDVRCDRAGEPLRQRHQRRAS